MKSSKGQDKEDCGVWLDTVQLKGKAKKKLLARPISKLLNPSADGAGYKVDVALNFTQTKMEMPKTKQSSISNFFIGQRRVLNKMSTTGGPNTGAQEARAPSAFPSRLTTKSTAEDLCDLINEPLWCDEDYKQRNDKLTEPLMWWEKEDEENHASSHDMINDFSEESCVDKSLLKRTFTPSKSEMHELNTQSQNIAHEDLQPNSLRGLPSQSEFNAFGRSFLNADGRTSTQKTFEERSVQNDKENSFSQSPKKTVPDSQFQGMSKNTRLEPFNSPRKGSSSPFKWTKPKSSPIKKQKGQMFRYGEDESLSRLFTQDSQGFRVIAHRGSQTRSPLKDQSNLSEEEMLFTQDSQGNMVIKH